jgi:hypothetical protein
VAGELLIVVPLAGRVPHLGRVIQGLGRAEDLGDVGGGQALGESQHALVVGRRILPEHPAEQDDELVVFLADHRRAAGQAGEADDGRPDAPVQMVGLAPVVAAHVDHVRAYPRRRRSGVAELAQPDVRARATPSGVDHQVGGH